jgi:hypothetical protein
LDSRPQQLNCGALVIGCETVGTARNDCNLNGMLCSWLVQQERFDGGSRSMDRGAVLHGLVEIFNLLSNNRVTNPLRRRVEAPPPSLKRPAVPYRSCFFWTNQLHSNSFFCSQRKLSTA